MKWQLILFVLLQVIFVKSSAQQSVENDSILTGYVNYLAAHTNLSYDSIHNLEQDSAFKMVRNFYRRTGPRGPFFIVDTDGGISHLDSATLSFLIKRRLKMPPKK